MKTYVPGPGEHIEQATKALVALALSSGDTATMTFNGTSVVAHPDSDPAGLAAAYLQELDRKHKEWLKSPKGQAKQRESERLQRISDDAKAAGILPFTIIDQAAWDTWVSSNSNDPYGACIVRYASRWANIMENHYKGWAIHDVADQASYDANIEGITGFMYGCAVAVLAKCWKYGEALRTWHNRKEQLGTEGERANESGGILNPALLTIAP